MASFFGNDHEKYQVQNNSSLHPHKVWSEQMACSTKSQLTVLPKQLDLKKLTVEQVQQIDALLSSLGEYGEVHLIVQRGLLKYINKVESHKAWNDEEYE